MKLFRKTGVTALCLAVALGSTACGSASAKGSKISQGNGVDKVLSSQVAAENEKQGNAETAGATEGSSDPSKTDEPSSSGGQTNTEADSTKTAADGAENGGAADSSVDIDLTVMSSDMVYATVYQLMFESDDYVGKTIKVRGNYLASWYDKTQQYYHCVIIQDATACCAQGLEFIWGDGSHAYPDDYPANDTEVEIIGEFETYVEDGYEYCRLKNASLRAV